MKRRIYLRRKAAWERDDPEETFSVDSAKSQNAGNNPNASGQPDLVIPTFLANVLQQIANEPMYQPPPPLPPRVITFKTLRDNGVELFLGDRIDELQIAWDWIEQTARVLEDLSVPIGKYPRLASQLLRQEAYEWWKRTDESAETPKPWTWAHFEWAFKQEYIPKRFSEDRRKQFVELQQGDMTLLEYRQLWVLHRATEWFNKLRPGSIDSFSDLASKFKAKLQENCTKRKKFTYLNTAGQRESENLTQFLTRWKEEVDKVEEMDDKIVLSLLLNGLRAGELYKEFCRKPPATYQEANHTAWEFADAETQLRAKKEAEYGFKPKLVQIKKEEAPRPSRPRHHYDPVIRVVNTEECQEIRKAPVNPPVNPTGSTGDTVKAEGSIVLPVELGSGDKTVWKKMRFIVVDIKCVHDAILGRPGINKVWAVISMPHLCMKFHTPGGVGEVRSDQRNARECYARAVKKMTKGVNVISQEITKGETREKLEPEAETVEIELHPGDPSRMVRIGANLPEDLKVEITQLAVRDGSRPVRQKKRYLASERQDFVRKEVKDLLSVGHIREVKYPDCLAKFNIEYWPRSAIKGQALADFLVEMTGLTPHLPVNQPIEQWWEMAVDGESGPKGYGGGIVFTTPEGFKIYHALVFNFKLTNNEVEYEALAGGLRLAQALKINRVNIISDSNMIVGQVTGNMESREGRMAQYKDMVLALLKGFVEFEIDQIPRAKNADAHLLSKLTQYALEHVSKLARVEILDRASIEKLEAATIEGQLDQSTSNTVRVDDHWMDDLLKYLTDRSLPAQDDRVRKVKLRAPRFQVIGGMLYKRAFGGPLLRCLTNREAERVIAEVHERVCTAHQMSRTLSQRIILLGYYWPTIVQDCERYVQKCRTCQVFYKYPGRSANYYHPVSNVISFARFGVDIIGAFPIA
ncbi:unnamed protein product [Cuscuta campestris]|uniref:RNase H type-1 domain-containing protein n=1 Tax=Cuscuta campestris TaxID=132261 RepID=A0A484MPT7_9ASTE|nr:unnamed protein product [Cuscuta campestris]